MASSRWHAPLLLAGVVAAAACFAQVEIQIEGAHGWAAQLPTWRVESHPLLDLFWGGRPMTGYHAWVFGFMALVFHLGLALVGRWSWRLEARVLGSVMLFWIVEDLLWFVFNPAFGWAGLNPVQAPWHKRWLLGLPQDYWVFTLVAGALLWWSWRTPRPRATA
jgi:hypothetical protein